MASVQELVPLIKTAVADVLAENPSDNGDVRLALAQVTALWNNPEHPFPVAEPGPPEPSADEVTITGLNPASLEVGQATEVTVTGTGFTEASTVSADGNPLATTYISATELSFFAPGPLAAGSVDITVDGSEPFPLEATAPAQRRGRGGDEDEPNRRNPSGRRS